MGLQAVLNVVSNTLTNYVNHIAETEIDFPKVEAGTLTATFQYPPIAHSQEIFQGNTRYSGVVAAVDEDRFMILTYVARRSLVLTLDVTSHPRRIKRIRPIPCRISNSS